MSALALQVFSISIAIAGLWLADLSLPIKMIILGTSSSLFFFTQYQLTTIIELQTGCLAELKGWVRVIERSVELSRLDTQNKDSAQELIIKEIIDENKELNFQERISPSWRIDLIALLSVITLSVLLAYIWVTLYKQNY
ncbi:MAG: hypothetical protein V4525_10890 [Pseudomonadota bacterium]